MLRVVVNEYFKFTTATATAFSLLSLLTQASHTDCTYLIGVLKVTQAWRSVWPDWAIFCTLGYFLKPFDNNYFPKLPRLLGIFCKGVKIIYFLWNHIWATFIDIWQFLSGHTARNALQRQKVFCQKSLSLFNSIFLWNKKESFFWRSKTWANKIDCLMKLFRQLAYNSLPNFGNFQLSVNFQNLMKNSYTNSWI